MIIRHARLGAFCLTLAACKGDGDDGDTQGPIASDPIDVFFALPNLLQTLQVEAGDTTSATVPVSLSAVPGYVQLAGVSLDLEGTMAGAVVAPVASPPSDGDKLEATVYVAGEDAADACAEGAAQTPGSVTLSGTGTATAISPATVDLDDDALAALNTGTATVCAEVSSPVALSITLPGLYLGLSVGLDCEEPAPEDIAGTWSGTYSCDNTCGGDDSGDVTLVVTQDGEKATYTDGDATYQGAVCGARFLFTGGGGSPLGAMYRESGELEIAADGKTATKRSIWTNGLCGGVCTDALTLQD